MIHTVTGAISKEDLGLTLSHEHFKWETDEAYSNRMYFDRQYDENLVQDAFDTILPLLERLYSFGCRGIAEASTPIGGQNLLMLKRLSEAAKINIIPNIGEILSPYVYHVYQNDFINQLAGRWIRDFTEGLDIIDGTVIRPGFIKLFISNNKLTDYDRATLLAAIKASRETGLPIHCHIMRKDRFLEVYRILKEEKADMSKFLWAHALKDYNEEALKLAVKAGIWLGLDIIQKPNFREYGNFVRKALEEGFSGKILLSQDCDFYSSIKEEGIDHCCCDIFTGFVPECAQNGVDEDSLIRILTVNPSAYYDIG